MRLSAWGTICLLVAAAAPGLALLRTGSENIQEYRFMRQASAVAPPNSEIWLPTRAALGNLKTEFPDYLNEQFLIKGDSTDPFPKPRDRWLYVGLDCYRRESPDDAVDPASGLREECRAACAGTRKLVIEKTLDAHRPSWGYQQPFWPLTTEQPVVGLYRCETSAPPRQQTTDCGAQSRRDSDVLRLAVLQYRGMASPRRSLGILEGLDGRCSRADLLLDFADEDAKTELWEEQRSALGLAQELKPNAEQARRINAGLSVLDEFDVADRVRRWAEYLRTRSLPVPVFLRRAGLRRIARARRFKLNAAQLGWAAIACQDLGDDGQASEILDQLVAEHPSEARWRDERGVLLSLMGKPQAAAADLEAAIALDPDSLETYFSLGSLYSSMNRRNEALKIFQRALSRSRTKGDAEMTSRILAETEKLSPALPRS